ncbi:unnamed protein product [Prorocentrum cordatum]|uniref:Uncharacterized protein n=1 Tax=Prorocentrum cordatum TaxID=2364126 RepID=A0ABN9R1K3_9DINO|nr:unnamed protein product [Polarella glacialis]
MRWSRQAEKKFRAVQDMLSDGLGFITTKVPIVNDAKKQRIHAPIQTVVNLSDTSFSLLLNSNDTKDCYPEPPGTIAGCAHLSNQQFFDVTALVKSVSPLRPAGRSGSGNRVVFNVEIIDGSMSGDRARTMPLTVFTDQATTPGAGGPPTWVFLNGAAGAPQSVSVSRIKGAQDDDGKFSFTTTKNTIIVEGATTGKGRHLAAEAATLLGLTDTASFVVKKFDEWVARDFSTEVAAETMRALFKAIANTVITGVEVLDHAKETFWQLTWLAGANIRTNDGKRLWFPVTVRDSAGTLALCIQEAAALKLSGFDDADDFEAACVAGKVRFSQMALVKIIRHLKTATAEQDSAVQPPVQNTTSDIAMPAALRMLRKSPHYTLAAESIVPDIPETLEASFANVAAAATIFRPCSQALALAEASQPSTLQEAGAGGYRITTNNVKDLLREANDAPGAQLTSFCT